MRTSFRNVKNEELYSVFTITMNKGRSKFACAVFNCISTKSDHSKSFHLLPKDPQRRLEWIEFCNNPELQSMGKEYLDKTHVCSLHFEEKMYIKGLQRRLQTDAVPTVIVLEESFAPDSSDKLSYEDWLSIIGKTDNGNHEPGNKNSESVIKSNLLPTELTSIKIEEHIVPIKLEQEEYEIVVSTNSNYDDSISDPLEDTVCIKTEDPILGYTQDEEIMSSDTPCEQKYSCLSKALTTPLNPKKLRKRGIDTTETELNTLLFLSKKYLKVEFAKTVEEQINLLRSNNKDPV